jgi:hypothetical protein
LSNLRGATVNTSALPAGSHTVIASATDTSGNTGTASIQIAINLVIVSF